MPKCTLYNGVYISLWLLICHTLWFCYNSIKWSLLFFNSFVLLCKIFLLLSETHPKSDELNPAKINTLSLKSKRSKNVTKKVQQSVQCVFSVCVIKIFIFRGVNTAYQDPVLPHLITFFRLFPPQEHSMNYLIKEAWPWRYFPSLPTPALSQGLSAIQKAVCLL